MSQLTSFLMFPFQLIWGAFKLLLGLTTLAVLLILGTLLVVYLFLAYCYFFGDRLIKGVITL